MMDMNGHPNKQADTHTHTEIEGESNRQTDKPCVHEPEDQLFDQTGLKFVHKNPIHLKQLVQQVG